MNHHAGWTLMSLVVVMLIMGVLSVVVMAKMPPSSTFEARGFTEVLIQDLRQTQVLAMSRNQRYSLILGASAYEIKDQNNTAVINTQTGSASTPYARDFTITPMITIVFDSLGRPYDASNSPLPTKTLTVSNGSTSQSVSIIAETGFIE